MGVIGGATGIMGAGSTLGSAVCVTSGASCVAVVSVISTESSTGFSSGIGSGGGKSSGRTKMVLICLGGLGGSLMPKKSKPIIATACTPSVKPIAMAFCLKGGLLNFFITDL